MGTHETLLAYLVRRLLENGANTSFVNQISDKDIPLDRLIADPVETAKAIQPLGSGHPKISLPRDILGKRRNSMGIDLSNEQRLASLSAALLSSTDQKWKAQPLLADGLSDNGEADIVRNPANRADVVGTVSQASLQIVTKAVDGAVAAMPIWQSTPPAERAQCLQRAADILEERMPKLLGLIVREAGKSLSNAIGEVREAVDFLRYYAESVASSYSNDTHRPLGPIVCISPWNFPLAIFTGQVAAALAAGNVVLAKPAEETPLIAAQAVRILREAGVPAGAVQLLPGDGRIGAALVGDTRIRGVMFTGSTEVARLIQKQLAPRLSPEGNPIPLIAETGGLNAMIVDSSALPEQVVTDVIASAFDSAGQRCSALRILCLQEDVADHVLTMLRGAVAELAIGSPDRLSVDIGPVISPAAQESITRHIEAMRGQKFRVEQLELPALARFGTFVPPTIIELNRVSDLKAEVFGPVLHVVRYRREDLDALIDDINASGYGLTFGLHSRIDETIAHVLQRVHAGNLYVNRNIIGAVVGVQPFGGHGLSGTGPKAGGPMYLRRLLSVAPALPAITSDAKIDNALATAYCDWLDINGHQPQAVLCTSFIARSPLASSVELPGPVGERNIYVQVPRGTVLCAAQSQSGVLVQVAAALATGNQVVIPEQHRSLFKTVPLGLKARFVDGRPDVVLFEGDGDDLSVLLVKLATEYQHVMPVFSVPSRQNSSYPLEWLVSEQSISTNTAAAGGNASLMSIG